MMNSMCNSNIGWFGSSERLDFENRMTPTGVKASFSHR